jgi:aspartate kinase
MSKLIVVKYGGSVLKDGSGIREAAEQVKSELDKGNKVVVVVSALKGVTDQLLKAAETINHHTPKHVQDHIIRLGEEQSALLFTSALELSGVSSQELLFVASLEEAKTA